MIKQLRLHLFNKSNNKVVMACMSIFLALGYVVIELTEWDWFSKIISGFIFLFIIFSLPSLKGAVARIILIMIVLTILILFQEKNVWSIILDGARVNLTLVTIFILTPILGITVRTGGYIEALKIVLKKLKNNVMFFYLSTSLLTHSLGVVLNIGSVSINHYLTSVSNVRSPRIIANALNRGFTTTIFWSPYFSAMALIVSNLNISWGEIVGYAIGYSLLAFTFGFLFELKQIFKEQKNLLVPEEQQLKEEKIEVQRVKAKMIELIFLILIMMLLVLALEHFTSFGMVLSICLVSIIFPISWCSLKGTFSGYKEELQRHLTTTLPNLQKEITLFLTAGLFSAAFVHSQWSDRIVTVLNEVFGHSPILMMLILSIVIIVTAIFGLHPIIVITILVTSIDPSQVGLSKEAFSVTLLASWGIANTLSPATAVNNLLAHSLNQPIMDVSLRWNWKYAMTMMILLPIYLYLLNI